MLSVLKQEFFIHKKNIFITSILLFAGKSELMHTSILIVPEPQNNTD